MSEVLDKITQRLTDEISCRLSKSGMMFRLFSRVKTLDSIKHKIEVKYGDTASMRKIQDVIGIRIVTYFQDDVDALALYFSQGEVVKSAIDEHDSSTFRPQRLNLTRRLPNHFIEEFRAALPAGYREVIDDTYEIQVRTVFSEGWHEVEHDLRYKCKKDWEDCDSYSRVLNGLIASLETSEWNMKALFNDMARHNFLHANYTAMLRNKMHIRLHGDCLSPELSAFLKEHKNVAEEALNTDRLIIMYTLLGHEAPLKLTYDTLLFLMNRIEMMDLELRTMESEETSRLLDAFLDS